MFAVGGCTKPPTDGKQAGAPAPSRNPKVTVQEAAEKPIEYAVEAVGSVEAIEEINIPAQVSGIIDEVNFKEGDKVDVNKDLVKIDLKRYELAVNRAKADNDRAKAQAELARKLYHNREILQEEGRKQKKEWVSEEQMAGWKADMLKAEADVDRTQADWDIAKRDFERATVHAPIAGIINGKFVSKGEYVKAETVVAKIVNMSTLIIRFTVPELEAARLKMDQEILFTVRFAKVVEAKARLFFITQKAESTTRSVECKAEILDKTLPLRPGTFAAVKCGIEGKSGVVVPERAVLPTERGFVVCVLEEDEKKENRVKYRPVKLGMRTESGVEITEGLKKGEKIVVDGAASLRDGMAVDIVKGS